MATTKITSPDLFDLGSLNTALKLPSGTTAERPTSPSTGEWRYNTTTNLIEFYDGAAWRDLQSEAIPPIPDENFSIVNWTGNGSSQSITGVGFQPDLVWVKERTATSGNELYDSTRGATKYIQTDSSGAESTSAQGLQSIDSDGFSVGNDGAVNESDNMFIAWCWKANGGTTVSNGEGSITSTVQANSAAGFSIVQYGGTGAAATIGHGLSSAPELIFTKQTTGSTDWVAGFQDWTKYLEPNGTPGFRTASSVWNDTAPTNTVFSVAASGGSNTNGGTNIAYCFHSVTGYQKFGEYTGNGSFQGPSVNTGFEPAYIMIKRVDDVGNWQTFDFTRDPQNPATKLMQWNTNDEVQNLLTGDYGILNRLSNGFQITTGTSYTGDTNFNVNGANYFYWAIAKNASTYTPTTTGAYKGITYTGNGYGDSVLDTINTSGLSWIKSMSNSYANSIFDLTTGPQFRQDSASTSTNFFQSGGGYLQNWGNAAFNLVAGASNAENVNANGITYMSWNWQAADRPAINTDGSLTSFVNANQAAGFSFVRFKGNETAGDTLGHGLGGTPEFAIYKQLDGTREWTCPLFFDASGTYTVLNDNSAKTTDTARWSAVSSTTVTMNASPFTNGTGSPYLAYFFRSITGYSQIGSYSGSGSDGNAVSTGFEPAFLMVKRIDSTGGWLVFDNTRNTSNPRNNRLEWNANQAEQTGSASKFVDFNSSDFEANGSDSELNASGGTYLYMVFAQSPKTETYSSAGNMSFLCVAGGGSGGQNYGGGGGAGGLKTSVRRNPTNAPASDIIALSAGTYTITVGGGAASVNTLNTAGLKGSDSSIAGPSLTTITTTGGGGGGGGSNKLGPSGGSGGGGAYGKQANNPGIDGQGHTGGIQPNGGSPYTNGGGGGAGSPGHNGTSTNGGSGGSGMTIGITGSDVTYGGGGGAGYAVDLSKIGGYGGPGGGGDGGRTGANDNGTAGTANTGGGGGGTGGQNSGSAVSGAGGSGVVILRLLTSEYSGATTGSPTVTTSGSETILTYTGSGTYVHS